jgi:hypothetical protein
MTSAKDSPDTTDEAHPVIVLGFDEKSKPRAARFAAAHAPLATKAANLMGLAVCAITPAVADLSKKLPAGRVYANGKGFVPNIRKNLFDKLVEASGLTLPVATAPNALPAVSLPTSWDDIDVGKLVLARDKPEDGWWEAVVTEKSDDTLTLRWQVSPKDPSFKRKVTQVALLNAGLLTP